MNYLNAISAEIKLDLEQSWSYKVNFVSEALMITVLYFSLILMDSGSSLVASYGFNGSSKELLLIGYILWSFSIMAINIVSSNISAEASRGTLEQKFTSIVPVYVLILGQFISSLLIEFIEIAVIILASIFIFKINLIINFESILLFIITLIGMYGIGLIFGGLTLKFKKIGQVIFITQILLLFISNTITNAVDNIFINLIPLTFGNDLIRKSISGQVIDSKQYILFLLISIVWLGIGIIVFKYFIKLSKKDGLINSY
jgi:ABC-2 type transport system permease protein